jgi:WD40 repeat protein
MFGSPVAEAKDRRWGLLLSGPLLNVTWLAKQSIRIWKLGLSKVPKVIPDIVVETFEEKNERFDLFLSYRRRDGSKLAWWLIRKIQHFVLPKIILDNIPPEKKKLYFRHPTFFVDTSYERASEEWLKTVFGALDRSDRLIVISTPSVFETITKVNAPPEPNWLVREVNRFLGDIPCEISDVGVDASGATVVALAREQDIPPDLAYVDLPSVKPGYADLGPSYRFVTQVAWTSYISLNFFGIGPRPAYTYDRQTLMGNADWAEGETTYQATFLSTLNSGAGGFVVTALRPANVIIGPGAATERFPGWLDPGLPSRLNNKPRRNWIDLRKYARWHNYGVGSELDKEIAKLIAEIYEVPERYLPDLYQVERRQRRKTLLSYGAASTIAAAIVAVILYVGYDYSTKKQDLERRINDVQKSVNDQQYEQAMRVALQGLPADYDPRFWRPGWSNPNVRKLLAKLAGAAQLSAYSGQLPGGNCPVQSAQFAPAGDRIVTASQGGTVTVWDSKSLADIATCDQRSVFPNGGFSESCDSPNWVRDSRFGGDAGTILSVGPYGAWIWKLSSAGGRIKGSGDHCGDIIYLTGGHHDKAVRTGAFDPDRKSVVTTSDDGTVRVWKVEDRTSRSLKLPKSILPPDYSYTTDAEFSPDGKSVAVSRRDGLVAIVDLESEQAQVLQESGVPAVWSIRFDPDGKRLVSASKNGEVIIWDIAHSNAKSSLPRQPRSVSSAVFSPNGRLILTASADAVAIWDAGKRTRLFVLKGHERNVLSASFSPDGKQIVTSSDDKTARIWSTISLPAVVRTSAAKSASMSADGRRLVVGGFDGRIIAYRIGDGDALDKLYQLNTDAGVVTSVAFGGDVNSGALATEGGAVLRWDAGSRKIDQFRDPPLILPQKDAFVAFSPKGDLAATATLAEDPSNNENYNRVWDMENGRSWPLEGAHVITSVEFSRDGTGVLAASEASTKDKKRLATVWDARTGKKTVELKHDGEVLSAHFSKDGLRIATTSLDFYRAHVWDAVTGKEIQVFNGHTYDVKSARFSPDGERVVTASSDRSVRVWDVQTGTQVLQFEIGSEANDAFFSGDGSHVLVVTEEGEILTYDVAWTRRLDRDLKFRVCSEKLSGIDKGGYCS